MLALGPSVNGLLTCMLSPQICTMTIAASQVTKERFCLDQVAAANCRLGPLSFLVMPYKLILATTKAPWKTQQTGSHCMHLVQWDS